MSDEVRVAAGITSARRGFLIILSLRSNTKARYRKAKALFQLRRFRECRAECDILRTIDTAVNADVDTLHQSCQIEMEKLEQLVSSIKKMQLDVESHWKQAWDLCEKANVALGKAHWNPHFTHC